MFNTHYRKELNLSDDALEASINAVRRVGDFADRLAAATGGTPELAAAADAAMAEVEAALFDDLNAPNALAGLFTFITAGERRARSSWLGCRGVGRARQAFARINGVLDIVPDREIDDAALVAWVEERLSARRAARERRDFAEADGSAPSWSGKGIAIEDARRVGRRWKRAGRGRF